MKGEYIMVQVGFQFHARRREVFEFVFDMADKNNLYIIGVEWFPEFRYEILSNLNQSVVNAKIRQMVLTRDIPKEGLSDKDFMILNKGNLIIKPGNEIEGRIGESDIGCIADEIIDRLWIKIINKYKRNMLKGAWGLNPADGARYFYKMHYYTEAAKKAYQNGYTLCAIAGNCIFEIPE